MLPYFFIPLIWRQRFLPGRNLLRNMIVLIFLCVIPEISLADTIGDVDATENQSAVSLDAEDDGVKMSMTLEDLRSKITEDVLEEIFENCNEVLKQNRFLENKLVEKGRVIRKHEKEADLSLMTVPGTLIQAKESCQMPFDEASHQLHKKFKLSRDDINKILPEVPLDGKLSSTIRDNCKQMLTAPECNADSPYRTADGHCNNLANPTWGSPTACQRRLLPAHYEGNSGFRVSVNGGPLPAPRTLSLNLHYHYNRPTEYLTHMYMFFGQLLDHDITLTPFSRTVDNQGIQCCPVENATHPQCAPIILSNDDPFFSQFGRRCLNFVRSASCPTCTMGARQLMSQVSAFIDASFVYGNTENQTNGLRANDGTGRMIVQESMYGDLLPPSRNPEGDRCSSPATNEFCFEAGDSRGNQHTVLAALQLIFLREHNRIAGELSVINPQWDDERLFQEARRILGAIMQIITYKEYLPITLGRDRMSDLRLWTGSSTRYNATIDPTMSVEFTTAAFRFGHSLINSKVTLNTTGGPRLLRNDFLQPFDLYRGYAGPLLRGASDSPAQWFDRHLVPDVTNLMYRIRGTPMGLDLASININRGRDNGVPTYVRMVEFCSKGKIVIRRFSDLTRYRLMGYQQSNALRENYSSVQDVDLWSGLLMETPNKGAVVALTTACIIGQQFKRLKYGDRFYFEHADQVGSFTYQQLGELRNMTLSQVICLNTDVKELSNNAMLFSSRNNPMIDCQRVRGVDLSYWKE